MILDTEKRLKYMCNRWRNSACRDINDEVGLERVLYSKDFLAIVDLERISAYDNNPFYNYLIDTEEEEIAA